MRLKHLVRLLVALMTIALLAGCGNDSAEPQSASADAHAGHDHGPGEHGDSHAAEINSTTTEDHAGHNHGPGEPGATPTAAVDELDWCNLHSVPESECTACDPSLIQAFKDKNDWCGGHGLPESHCRLCNPEIIFEQEEILRARQLEQSGRDIEITLNFRPNAALCATNGALIQFASTTTADRVGLRTVETRGSDLAHSFEAPAEVVFDETDATVVTSTVASLVTRWLVSPGDVVTRGDVLAVIKSPAIAELKSSLISANAAHAVQEQEMARQRQLRDNDLISAAEYDRQVALAEQTRAEYVSTRGLLLSAGLTQDDIDEVLKHGSVSNQFALRAPTDGLVVERIARLGELLDPGAPFAMLADPSAMWIEARLTEEQVRRVSLGQDVVFASDGRGLRRVGAKVIWVSRMLDPHTRTATVRAEVIDPTNDLSAGEFGRVLISERHQQPVTLVPKDAVQWEGCCNVVFVREAVDRFRPRKVEIRDGEGPYYQVVDGLAPGESVVVDGAFLLKTELKKTSIGAGCCGLDAAG